MEEPKLVTLYFETSTIPLKHKALKRSFDILFSIVLLILLALPLLLIAFAIKLTSKGPVFFSHYRVGRGGRLFRCYKFRTMYADAEERLEALLKNNPLANREWLKLHKLKTDPRVTPLGRLLRQSSLDELPQFWNVIKGDLSVVGPRPVVYAEVVNHFKEKAAKILSIRPGITGIWQVSGRSDTTYLTRLQLDENYVDNCSMWLDLKLIAKTIPCMFFPKGAY